MLCQLSRQGTDVLGADPAAATDERRSALNPANRCLDELLSLEIRTGSQLKSRCQVSSLWEC